MSKTPAFTVQIQHDGGSAAAVRFQLHSAGKGTLAFPGMSEGLPARSQEVSDLDLDAVRAGRFILVDDEGRRRSYQLSRLDRIGLLGLAASEWHALAETNDGGFRYLSLPRNQGAGAATVQVQAAAVPAGGGLRARAIAAGRSTDTAATAPTLPSAPARAVAPAASLAAAVPERAPAAAAPSTSSAQGQLAALTRKSLDGLDRAQAVSALAEAYGVISTLEGEVGRLRGALEASKQRETDLVDVIARWQSRG